MGGQVSKLIPYWTIWCIQSTHISKICRLHSTLEIIWMRNCNCEGLYTKPESKITWICFEKGIGSYGGLGCVTLSWAVTFMRWVDSEKISESLWLRVRELLVSLYRWLVSLNEKACTLLDWGNDAFFLFCRNKANMRYASRLSLCPYRLHLGLCRGIHPWPNRSAAVSPRYLLSTLGYSSPPRGTEWLIHVRQAIESKWQFAESRHLYLKLRQ